MKQFILFLLCSCFLYSCDDKEPGESFNVDYILVGSQSVSLDNVSGIVDPSNEILIGFDRAIRAGSIESAISLKDGNSDVPVSVVLENNSVVRLTLVNSMKNNTAYVLTISSAVKSTTGDSYDGRSFGFSSAAGNVSIASLSIEGVEITDDPVINVPLDATIDAKFTGPLDPATVPSSVTVTGIPSEDIDLSLHEGNTVLTISINGLDHLEPYTVKISNNLQGANGETFEGVTQKFYTAVDQTPKFDPMPDDELLTLIQQQTFKYFWDFAHPFSGMARERSTDETVTTGGTGFGLMSIIVGIERGFVTREQGIQRIEKIVDFLSTADRFHGAWPHWMNGETGNVVPFSANDNGGDLVETALLVQGLLAVRQYLNPATETVLIDKINSLWNTVDWYWYTKGGEKVLYWHWSPNLGWIMNHQIRGHNETLITYVLAASSTTHPIEPDVYHLGYARSGALQNGNSFYGITLPLGDSYGGPLFFAHYSFLGLDPRNLQDQYANYWEQNVNHTLINRAYVIDNPKNFVGYSEDNWGLTASDGDKGYSAHSPTNDLGVITPTAALSSFPYTPDYSMDALKFFYYTVGDKLWGNYGFYDAYNPTEGWVANTFLAIDQGPIIVMIENHRSGLIWDLFMSAPEVQAGLTTLGFTY
jgi:hypothetical protein